VSLLFRRAGLVVALLAACTPPPEPPREPLVSAPLPPPPAPATLPPSPAPAPKPFAELALATHHTFLEAIRVHDDAGLSACYAPEAKLWLGPGLDMGAADIDGLSKAAWAAFPDAKLQWSTFLQSGRSAALEIAWTGSQAGRLGDVPPSKRVIGSHALILERFAPSGLLVAQRAYFDAETIRTDLVTQGSTPHAFDGLPTTQTSAVDQAVSAEDDPAIRGLAASFAHGAFDAARPLGNEASVWSDATKGRAISGKGAVGAWISFLEHSFKGGGAQLVDTWSTGEWLVLEWNSSPNDGAAPNATRAAELVRFEGGHIREVRTYRSSRWGGASASAGKPRAKNQ
jgi:hypothetical protein